MFYFSTRIQTILSGIVSHNTVRHAYLFSGPPGALLSSAAEYLMMSANCTSSEQRPCSHCSHCKSILSKTFIDTYTLSTSTSLKIEDIRSLHELVKYGPSIGSYFFVIVDQAHLLTTQAGNAFLKLLEEPPSGVVFILLTPTPARLLSTIRSRCQHLSIPKASTDQLLAAYNHRVSKDIMPALDEESPYFTSILPYVLDQPQPLDMSSYITFHDFQQLSFMDVSSLSQEWTSQKSSVPTYFCLWIYEIWGSMSQQMTQSLRYIELLIENISQMQYNLNLRLHLDHTFIKLRSNF